MAIERLKTVYFLGSLINNVKGMFSKINEIVDTLNNTNNYLEGVSGTGSYKKYVAIINQIDNNAPEAITILDNTLGATVTWSYTGIGEYKATCAGAFTADKTAIFFAPSASASITPSYVFSQVIDLNECYFLSMDNLGNNANNIIKKVCVEIRVYN